MLSWGNAFPTRMNVLVISIIHTHSIWGSCWCHQYGFYRVSNGPELCIQIQAFPCLNEENSNYIMDPCDRWKSKGNCGPLLKNVNQYTHLPPEKKVHSIAAFHTLSIINVVNEAVICSYTMNGLLAAIGLPQVGLFQSREHLSKKLQDA